MAARRQWQMNRIPPGAKGIIADEGRTRNVTPALLSIDGCVVFLVTRFGAEGQANGVDYPGGEVAQVFSVPRELANRAVAKIGDVQIALPIEGQSSGCAQPGGGEVPQIDSVPRKLTNRIDGHVGDVEVASPVECDKRGSDNAGGGEVTQVVSAPREHSNRVVAEVGGVEVA